MTRGIATIADLRARSVVDPVTRCWHWQGAIAKDGSPRLWTFDYSICDKRSCPGARAAFMIGYGRAPRGLAYRCCGSVDCVNPVHVSEAPTRAAIGLFIRSLGRRKGTHVQARRCNLEKAYAARGVVPTPAAAVLEIRAADASVTNVSLAAKFGIAHSTVSAIRLRKARVGVVA